MYYGEGCSLEGIPTSLRLLIKYTKVRSTQISPYYLWRQHMTLSQHAAAFQDSIHTIRPYPLILRCRRLFIVCYLKHGKCKLDNHSKNFHSVSQQMPDCQNQPYPKICIPIYRHLDLLQKLHSCCDGMFFALVIKNNGCLQF